jgi:hypothetical protein
MTILRLAPLAQDLRSLAMTQGPISLVRDLIDRGAACTKCDPRFERRRRHISPAQQGL